MRAFDIEYGVAEVVRPGGVAGSDGAFVKIPDAHFLFHAEFKRAGSDLHLTGDDGHRVVVPGYFTHEKLPTLLSPEGASITGDLIEALVGSQASDQYAQAGNGQATGPEVIGRVATASGSAVAVRNGVAVTLNVGDAVYKGDVIQTSADSAVGVIFTDNTTFNLSSNARMVLNEFVYSPGGSSNSALISLVQGSISFIAGEVAHSGDMKVGTPVATMGIRGTAVSVDISADNGTTTFSVMAEPNGQVGSFNLLDKTTGQIIGTVSSSAVGWVVSPAGPLQVLAQQFQKPADVLARELQIVQQVFNVQNVGQAILQQSAPQQQQKSPNSGGSSGSSTPPPTENIQDNKVIKITITSVSTTVGGDKADSTTTQDVYHPVIQQQTIGNPAPFFVGGGTLTRIAAPASALQGANIAVGPDVSADGRFVVFFTTTQLPGNNVSNNIGGDVYLYDRQTQTTTAITHASSGSASYQGASISLDGHYVVYQSGGDDGQSTVYVYDRLTNTSTALHASAGNAHIDGAGTFIVMEGQAANQSQGVLVTDLAGHVVTDVSGTDGQGHNVAVWSPEINADGRLITFYSSASEIVINGQTFAGSPNGQNQIFVFDRVADKLQLVSVSSQGDAGDGSSGAITQDGQDWPASISADGRYVVFQSDATNLVAGDTNQTSDIFVRDLLTGTTERVSVGEVHSGNYAGQGVFTVNAASTVGDQSHSAVTALADGGFLETWDDNAGGVFAQRYDMHGNVVGANSRSTRQRPLSAPQARPVSRTADLSSPGQPRQVSMRISTQQLASPVALHSRFPSAPRAARGLSPRLTADFSLLGRRRV